MNIKVIVPNDSEKLDKQIEALAWQIEHDTNEKDKDIHIRAINDLTGKKKASI